MRDYPVMVEGMPNPLHEGEHVMVAPSEHKSDIDPPRVTATLLKMGGTIILRADCSSRKLPPLDILHRAVAQLVEREDDSTDDDDTKTATG